MKNKLTQMITLRSWIASSVLTYFLLMNVATAWAGNPCPKSISCPSLKAGGSYKNGTQMWYCDAAYQGKDYVWGKEHGGIPAKSTADQSSFQWVAGTQYTTFCSYKGQYNRTDNLVRIKCYGPKTAAYGKNVKKCSESIR